MELPSIVEGCEGDPCAGPPGCRTWHCVNCDSSYCDTCWGKQGPHKRGKLGPDGWPHEKADINIVRGLEAILKPPESQETLMALHREDEDTIWFGVNRNPASGRPIFRDYGRYSSLMADSGQYCGGTRWPQLVSFIGQTNAGKSTLIKMLVDHGQRKLDDAEPKLEIQKVYPFASPVVGSAKNDKIPTSGDVHLYADPLTYFGQMPMLYADCEGLDGGEEAPMGVRFRKLTNSDIGGKFNRKIFKGASRDLAWAIDDETSGREYAVRHLYPRLLYTFSDVIVFVLRNPKTFQSVALKLLLDWAAASLEKSINQPSLPHAIIALNATDPGVDKDEWEVAQATENLMSFVNESISTVPEFIKYASVWRERGKKLHSMKELIECYYSSIRVVRIPAKGRYMLIDQQVGKLHEEIVEGCNKAFATKERARMLANADELNVYLQAGFDHFSSKLDSPFNFIEVSLKNNPIPQDFGDHILTLAAAIHELRPFTNGPKIFEALSYMVASCILLDCVRQRRLGTAEELFEKYYRNLCLAALDQFCDVYWPCSFYDKRGRSCQNVKSRHDSKGHQNDKGKIIGTGRYESNFSPDAYSKDWIQLLKSQLISHEKELREKRSRSLRRKASEIEDALQLHQRHMDQFWSELRSASSFQSHATCFCCLMEIPQHPLPCGHVLCTQCSYPYSISI